MQFASGTAEIANTFKYLQFSCSQCEATIRACCQQASGSGADHRWKSMAGNWEYGYLT